MYFYDDMDASKMNANFDWTKAKVDRVKLEALKR